MQNLLNLGQYETQDEMKLLSALVLDPMKLVEYSIKAEYFEDEINKRLFQGMEIEFKEKLGKSFNMTQKHYF